MRHRLLVMRPVGRQDIARRRQRLAEPGDIAMSEYRKHPAEQRHQPAIDLNLLGRQELDDCLRHGQTDGAHRLTPSRALRQPSIMRR